MRGGGFPARAAQGLSLLLYSPAQDGKHFKCFPLRAELATNLNSGPPGPGIRRARRGSVTCQKGTGLFWSVLSGKTSRSSGNLLSSVSWRSMAFSEVCGKFWTCRAHRGFAITNPQVERLGICGVVGLSSFCRILPESRRSRCLPHFRSAGKKLETFDQTAIFDNKTAGKQGVIISVWSEVPTFSPHFRF